MTATNIPGLDTGMFQSEGGEGGRFVGVQLYDGLTRFDLTQGAHAPDIKPGLATSWDVTPDATNWTFHLRPGVKFTDGTPWNADAAIFNLDRMTNKSSPDYYPELNATAGLFLGGIASSKKIDDMTIQITTKGSYSYLLGDLALLPFGSPTAIKADRCKSFVASLNSLAMSCPRRQSAFSTRNIGRAVRSRLRCKAAAVRHGSWARRTTGCCVTIAAAA